MMTMLNQRLSCYHCGEPVPDGLDLQVEIFGQQRPMCCAGCDAVARAIVENHLEDFYKHRTESATTADALIPEVLQELSIYDNETLQKSFVHQQEGDIREASLMLEGIVCAACVWLNERHVKQLPGVQSFYVNYSSHRAQVIWDDSQTHLSDILKSITEIGYQAHPFDPGLQESLDKKERGLAIRRMGIAGVGMMQVMMMAIAMYLGEVDEGMKPGIQNLLRWASLIITLPVIFYSGQAFFLSAWRDLKRRQLGMDVPVSLAISGAFLASVWATLHGTGEVYFDSVTMFIFFLLVGRFLETSARHRAGQVAEALVRLSPATAHRQSEAGLETVPVAELQLGDQLLVKPGETVPADGRVVQGHSSVDESLLTGESVPLAKQTGDLLVGGTINRDSPLTMQVERLGQDTVLSGISRLLERAHAEKPAIALFANRVAAWFVLALLIVAVAVYGYWSWRLPEDAFWITLSVLVVTCPCALSLATPVAVTAATGALTRLGVLTTRGHALETLAKVTDVVFDKTGTLTKGQIKLRHIETWSGQASSHLHALAAGLEAHSEHPIAQALRSGIDELAVDVIETEPGQGVLGRYRGKLYRLGSLDYVKGWHDGFMESGLTGTRVYLADQSAVLAAFDLSDTLRSGVEAVIQALKTQGAKVHLLSGDNEASVKSVANGLGIEAWHARQLPEDKLSYVKAMQQQGSIIVMVGDGVNDAPVLAVADVSVAMGQGAQLAQASADMVLLSDELDRLPASVAKARETMRIIRQNIGWAIGYNLMALPLAAAGFVAPWMAAIGMSLSSLLVVLNALRLRDRYRS